MYSDILRIESKYNWIVGREIKNGTIYNNNLIDLDITINISYEQENSYSIISYTMDNNNTLERFEHLEEIYDANPFQIENHINNFLKNFAINDLCTEDFCIEISLDFNADRKHDRYNEDYYNTMINYFCYRKPTVSVHRFGMEIHRIYSKAYLIDYNTREIYKLI